MRTLGCVVLSILLLGAGAACGGKAPPNTSTSSSTLCSQETRADAYAAGIEKTEGGVTVKLLDSRPAPPAKGVNNWTVELLGPAHQPMDGASFTVTPFMPDHGHGTSVKPSISAMGGGKYQVSSVYLFMPGLWEVTFNVTAPGASTDSAVVFRFCVDG